jgi:hypothetical protein
MIFAGRLGLDFLIALEVAVERVGDRVVAFDLSLVGEQFFGTQQAPDYLESFAHGFGLSALV